jgi:hypothetical protein
MSYAQAGRSGTTPLASTWPDAIDGLGPRISIAFSRCERCVPGRWASHPVPSVALAQWGEAGTFAAYGLTALCLRHALEIEAEMASVKRERQGRKKGRRRG